MNEFLGQYLVGGLEHGLFSIVYGYGSKLSTPVIGWLILKIDKSTCGPPDP